MEWMHALTSVNSALRQLILVLMADKLAIKTGNNNSIKTLAILRLVTLTDEYLNVECKTIDQRYKLLLYASVRQKKIWYTLVQ